MLTNLEQVPAAAPVASPRPGDVVVQKLADPPFLFGLNVYPCALQQPCGLYEQAERHGLALARRFAVDLWREEDGRFVRLGGYRSEGD